MKKIIYILLIASISFSYTSIFAYEYIDSKNESAVKSQKTEIYDRKEMYEFLAGEKEEEEILDFTSFGNNMMWWPIGSKETVEVDGKLFATGNPEYVGISSYFGPRTDPITGASNAGHGAIDIPAASNSSNVIAAKDGMVLKSGDCGSSSYGNCVLIEHGDGTQTRYAHMYDNSLTVKIGETVKQGQVIGKVGSTGRSTGPHLHFEVILNGNRVDPLNYVDPKNPRPSSNLSNQYLQWVRTWEGTEGETSDGKNYIIKNIGDGVRTVGYGVTLENNIDSFKKLGIDVNNYSVGDSLPITIVDQVELMKHQSFRKTIEIALSKNGITLKENQIQAITSFTYQNGPAHLSKFCERYKKYGDTQDLYDNHIGLYYNPGTQFEEGLKRRRKAEWELFHNNKYVCNGTCPWDK